MADGGPAASPTVATRSVRRVRGAGPGTGLLALVPYALLSAAAVVGTHVARVRIDDWHYVTDGAHALLVTDHLSVYVHHPVVQIGPLALLLAALIVRLFGSAASAVVCLLIAAAYGPAVFALARLVPSDAGRRRAAPTLLVAATFGLLPWIALAASRHIDDALATLLIVAALHAVRRDRIAVTVVLLVLAVAATPSAVVVAPLLVVSRTGARIPTRRQLGGCLAYAVGLAAVWLPFAVATHRGSAYGRVAFATPQASLWRLAHLGEPMPAWTRAVQLLAALAVAYAARRSAVAVVFAGEAVRVALDPGQWAYHFAVVAVAAVAVDTTRAATTGASVQRRGTDAPFAHVPVLRLIPRIELAAVPVAAVPVAAALTLIAMVATPWVGTILLIALAAAIVARTRRRVDDHASSPEPMLT